jgi:hypothetical protein
VVEFGLIDKVFVVTLNNACSNAKTMETLTPMFFGYLGSYPTPRHGEGSLEAVVVQVLLVLPLPIPPHLHLPLLLVSSQLT